MAADKSTAQTVLLSGFSYGAAHASSSATGDKNVTCVDKITPLERRYDGHNTNRQTWKSYVHGAVYGLLSME